MGEGQVSGSCFENKGAFVGVVAFPAIPKNRLESVHQLQVITQQNLLQSSFETQGDRGPSAGCHGLENHQLLTVATAKFHVHRQRPAARPSKTGRIISGDTCPQSQAYVVGHHPMNNYSPSSSITEHHQSPYILFRHHPLSLSQYC